MIKGFSITAAFMTLLAGFNGCNLDGILDEFNSYPDDMDGMYVGTTRYSGTDETSSLDVEVVGKDVSLVEGLDGVERIFAGDFTYDSDQGEFAAELVFESSGQPVERSSAVPDTMEMDGSFEVDSLVITGDFTVVYTDGTTETGTWVCEQETGPS